MGLSVKAAYDIWAQTYDDCENATRDLDADVLRAQQFDLAGARVIEIGCGTGKNTIWLASQAAEVVAIDFSEKMLQIASRRVQSERVRFHVHDIREPWPVPEQFADFVICNLVLEHIEDIGAVFSHARKAMSAAGTLFISELHPYRQLMGKQARFLGPNDETVAVPAFLHEVSEFIAAGLAEGLRMAQLSEWRDKGDERSAPPRLLSISFGVSSPTEFALAGGHRRG